MADYWQTGMAQTYKSRTQQDKFKRDAEKRGKGVGFGSKLGGLLFGAPGSYFGGEIGGMMSGVSREDIAGDQDDWFMNTRESTLQGLDDMGMNAAIESIKSGNFFGAVGGAMGGGKIGIPGTESTFGDLSSFMGGEQSGGTGGDFVSRMMGGGDPDMPPDFVPGGGADSMLGRVMGNVDKQIPEGMDTNTFLVHKQMFPDLTPQEAADKYEIPLDQYIAQLMNMGKSGMSLGSTGRMGE